MPRALRVLFAAAEVAPYAKVGGLADVVGALPASLGALGIDARVVFPCYPYLRDSALRARVCASHVRVAPSAIIDSTVDILRGELPNGVRAYMVRDDAQFGYAADSERTYALHADPYIVFGRSVADLAVNGIHGWRPDVLHCHDWHAALPPAYLRGAPVGERKPPPATVYTVHNLAYRGDFPATVHQRTGLPPWQFSFDGMEFHGQFCFAKGGLAYADMVTTVSPTYAQEVLTPAYGHGLEGHMQYLARLGRLRGIVNGIDTGAFDPATDPAIAAPYDLARPAGKRRCKAVLQADCRLPDAPDVAVLGMVSRIADQKGFDLLVAAARDLIALPAQIVVLGAGDELLSRQLSDLESAFPRAVRVHIGFDSYLAQRIYAGADMFLMPSRFEPCGLGQLIALRYGTIPVVRGTGGLKDTVHDADECPTSGNGFVFSELTAASLVAAARRAIAAYRDRGRWQSLVVRALREDHSWDRSAREYAELYTQLVAGTSGVRPPTRASSSA